eukprot:Protomagalhaensia_wolfi_Nauph_80__4826@NODE_503_length_2419_cov_77_231092_g376_i0_p1_GENE_NODE_503_length_2419_cov_77_231092_g376_i0NODE_503_length_2419_cov_77_231092_g376_i0_p1_ORF_typecomplete_len361_score27_78HEAT_2/PF13646_6/1_1e04HEAT_2/PF13646_6/0_08MitMem_reg/PF13012_6/0_35_NODE_503_length_2419_cov_77_231092_g376_i01311213
MYYFSSRMANPVKFGREDLAIVLEFLRAMVEWHRVLGRLVRTSDIEEGLPHPHTTVPRNMNQTLQLLSYLEALHVTEAAKTTDHERIRRVASLITNFETTNYDALVPTLGRTPLERPVYSCLMVQSDDPWVLLALCHVIRSCFAILDLRRVVYDTLDTKLSGDVTVLDRLLQLLEHPFWPIRRTVIHTLSAVLINHSGGSPPAIGKKFATDCRELLAMPRPVSADYDTKRGNTLLDLFNLVVRAFPLYIPTFIDCGFVEDLLLILESHIELSVHGEPTLDILDFLWVLLKPPMRSEQQIEKLRRMGCFDVVHKCLEPCRTSIYDLDYPMYAIRDILAYEFYPPDPKRRVSRVDYLSESEN